MCTGWHSIRKSATVIFVGVTMTIRSILRLPYYTTCNLICYQVYLSGLANHSGLKVKRKNTKDHKNYADEVFDTNITKANHRDTLREKNNHLCTI